MNDLLKLTEIIGNGRVCLLTPAFILRRSLHQEIDGHRLGVRDKPDAQRVLQWVRQLPSYPFDHRGIVSRADDGSIDNRALTIEARLGLLRIWADHLTAAEADVIRRTINDQTQFLKLYDGTRVTTGSETETVSITA